MDAACDELAIPSWLREKASEHYKADAGETRQA
jgi:hypothetical protein